MFGRFLSFLGFIPGLSGLSGLAGYSSGMSGGSGGAEDLEADGEAAVSFKAGTPLASADAEETPDSRRERITDRDLVWPGKVETIQISNPEPIAYRFDLTVTDLNPAFYIRRPPQGGVPQREGGVLLQPGDGASFEVVFVPPPAGEKLKTRTFSFVLTCFDPRRTGDPGEIVQDLPLRWVGLPTETDLQITAVPPVVVTRPWRREAQFAVRLANKSFLPPTIGMTILRAPTKEALERGNETVGSIQQALAARTPGVWQCLLPPPARRGSYYATVRGAAQAAESVSTPLALPRPVLIRYVPWLRMGRDWAFLLGMILFLVWLAWGFPVRKTPIVRVTLNFAGLEHGQMPPDSQFKDLSAQMILLDEHGHDQEGRSPISGIVNGNTYEFAGPTHWYGFHWPSARHPWWNIWSRQEQRFRVTVAAAEAERSAFKRYDLNALQPDGKPFYSAANALPGDPLVIQATFTAPAVHGVLVNLQLGHLGALAGKEMHTVSVRYTLEGQEQPPRKFELIHDTAGGLRPITLDLTDAVPLGSAKTFTVKVTANGLSSNDVQEIYVRRRDKPLPITLTFPDSYPRTASRPAGGAGEQNGAGQNGGGQGGAGGQNGGGQSASIQPPVAITPPVPVAPHPVTPHPVTPPIKPVIPGSKPPVTNPPGVSADLGHSVPTIPFHLPVPPPGQTQINPGGRVTLPSPGPSTPTGLVARAAGPTQIRVQWHSVPGGGLYLVYRSGGSGGRWPYSTHNTFFNDSGCQPGVVYKYRIQNKQGTRSSGQSEPTSALTPPLVAVPATVTLTVTADGGKVHAALNFTNVSRQTVYLDKVSACAGHKIGDDVFRILADGQPVPFSGQKSKRRSDPGGRQFITLGSGESVRQDVVLNDSYRFPSGTHSYSVTYSAPHNYPGRLQSLTLTSSEEHLNTTR